jgi:hypothetical protein
VTGSTLDKSIEHPERRYSGSERLAAIIPMLEFRRLHRQGKNPVTRGANGEELRTLVQLARYIAGICNVNPRTVWKWYCKYNKGSYDALAHARSDRGRSRFFRKHPAIALFVEHKYRAERTPAAEIHAELASELKDKTPSLATLRTYLKSLPRPRRGAPEKRGGRH